MGDEEGFVTVVNSSNPLPECFHLAFATNRPRGQWAAHHNAIFDIAWCKVRLRPPDEQHGPRTLRPGACPPPQNGALAAGRDHAAALQGPWKPWT